MGYGCRPTSPWWAVDALARNAGQALVHKLWRVEVALDIGPNVSIDYADGREAMHHGVRSTRQSLDIIERASGVRPEVDDGLATRLSELRRASGLEQQLAEVQELVDVLDCKPPAQRASAGCQRQYDGALARVDAVLREVPASHRPLADAVRRQVIAARAGRPPTRSPRAP